MKKEAQVVVEGEVGVVVQEVTQAGEVVFVKERDARKRGNMKLGKRPRTVSQTEDIRIDGVMVKKKSQNLFRRERILLLSLQ